MELNNIKNFVWKLLKTLAERCFLFSLILISLSLVFGNILFYQYYFSVEKIEPLMIDKQIYLEEKIWREILKEWDRREKKFKEIETKTFLNPFSEARGLTPTL